MNDTTSSIEQLRLQLLANNYSPIRNRDKRTFCRDWPSLDITPEVIKSWSRMSRDKATGLRIEDGLAAIDIDIDDPIIDDIADAILDLVPELGDPNAPLLVRKGKGRKEAWFVRTADIFGRIHSAGWTPPGRSADDAVFRVEIFGGGSARQFGAFGSHTVSDSGEVLIEYQWVDRSPADTPKQQLPLLTKSQFHAIADLVDRMLLAAGWTKVLRSAAGGDSTERVYDLTNDMEFDLLDGDTVTMAQLKELVVGEEHVRCSASWLEGESAVNRSRCLVSLTRAGYLAIFETASGVTHVEAAGQPRDFNLEIDRIAEKLAELSEKRRNKVQPADDAVVAATKLLATYAFCPNQPAAPAVPIWTTEVDAGINMAMFRTLMLPNCTDEVGPRGGRVRINPVDLWASSDRRVTVGGIRLRPDMPRPLFKDEAGVSWVNAYAPPAHDAEGGTALPGWRFLENLLPKDSEREWFLKWLAYKLRNPHIPGPAVIMLAEDFGTGRGTLGVLIGKLFGPRYVRSLPFSIFAGKTYQSQYNEWAVGALVVVVSESSESDGSTYQTKHNTYEHLKEIVDPRPTEREVVVKTRGNYRAISPASYIIATNNEDAIPLPADDRRFAVLTNGRPQDMDYWNEINAWMDREENIAAFHRELMLIDTKDYSPFAVPPKSAGKRNMVEASRSDLDRALEVAIASLQSDVVVMEQLVPLVQRVADQESWYLPDLPISKLRSVIHKAAAKLLYKVGERGGHNERLMVEKKRYYVWARTSHAADKYARASQDDVRRDVLRNGSPTGEGGLSKLALLARKQPDNDET